MKGGDKRSNKSFHSTAVAGYASGMIFYVASKTRHAPMWRAIRDKGISINSTWIDEAGLGETPDYRDLASRCINEASTADSVIIYAEPGDTLQGALLECGAALASGRPVVCVGGNERFSRVFAYHPLMHSADSLDDAFVLANQLRSTSIGQH
jgi:hypothetical protein